MYELNSLEHVSLIMENESDHKHIYNFIHLPSSVSTTAASLKTNHLWPNNMRPNRNNMKIVSKQNQQPFAIE